ncbi:hypothetical protein KOR34_52890 [Posidoniimonas corsicana]|uniref:YXWGXW repeat (2 copies) n=1 Tax=Posidoniimonas corsicana TaxID=1938618 RepID=A0A5C5US90_9BACT|nr:hypothetical protein [Posidoniimonas corsicana]TWT29234.1 hypothetical protein KOR34_52890 [Posidoniimonas corsicana]
MKLQLACGLLAAGLTVPATLAQLPTPADPGADPNVRPAAGEPQVLDHGPVHEAFADPLKYDPTAEQLMAPKPPPEPVNEIPPEFKPEGENVEWIPGYWMYDEPRKDYIWVSGVYRALPPGRTWVVGYWSESDRGYAWTPGFWTSVDEQSVQYLPYPPESLEEGPTSPPPGDNYFWIPGCWQYRTSGYAWQAGYWYQGNTNWVWTPHHYCYTPRGAIYVRGYWDYPLAGRGLLYAPVYWNSGYAVGYRYRPRSVLSTVGLLTSLYIGPRYSYYYGPGSYYANYNGFRPWYSAYSGYGYYGRRGYDPLLAYYSWNFGRNQRGWQDRAHNHWNDDWRRWNQRDDRRGRGDDNFRRDSLVRSVDQLTRENRNDFRLTRVDDRQLERYRNQAGRYDEFRNQRQRLENSGDRVTRDQLTRGQGERGDRGPRGDRTDRGDRGNRGPNTGELADRGNRGDRDGNQGGRQRGDFRPGARGELSDARRRGEEVTTPQQGDANRDRRASGSVADNPRLNVPDWARERGRSLSDYRRGNDTSAQRAQQQSQANQQAAQRSHLEQQARAQADARRQLDQQRSRQTLGGRDGNPLRSADPRSREGQPSREMRAYRGPVDQAERGAQSPPAFRGFRGNQAPPTRPEFNRSTPQQGTPNLNRGTQLRGSQPDASRSRRMQAPQQTQRRSVAPSAAQSRGAPSRAPAQAQGGGGGPRNFQGFRGNRGRGNGND